MAFRTQVLGMMAAMAFTLLYFTIPASSVRDITERTDQSGESHEKEVSDGDEIVPPPRLVKNPGLQFHRKMASDSLDILERLRTEPFNIETERLLEEHPYVLAAEAGTLTSAQLRAFLGEQYHIQLSDAASFAALAGHTNFTPKSLTGMQPPAAVREDGDLFQFLLGGELYASSMLLKQAQAFGFPDEEALISYPPTALAQGYPSFWARLALAGKRAQGAAGVAINFPAWGRMCQRIHTALKSGKYGEKSDDEIAFMGFFATPIEGLDAMAEKVLDESSLPYTEFATTVRLLQEYEVFFWDACFAAK